MSRFSVSKASKRQICSKTRFLAYQFAENSRKMSPERPSWGARNPSKMNEISHGRFKNQPACTLASHDRRTGFKGMPKGSKITQTGVPSCAPKLPHHPNWCPRFIRQSACHRGSKTTQTMIYKIDDSSGISIGTGLCPYCVVDTGVGFGLYDVSDYSQQLSSHSHGYM